MTSLIDLDSTRRYPIADRLTIGRGLGCDVVVNDPLVSAAHAEIIRSGGAFLVRDLGSRRGTFLGNHRVAEARLEHGAELLIGPARLRFDHGSASAELGAGPVSGAEREELRRLRAVVELGRAIGAEHDLERLLERVLTTCFQLLPADRGAIIVYPPKSRTPCATIARTRRGAPVAAALSTTVLSQLMSTQKPYVCSELGRDVEAHRSSSLSAQGVRSLVAVPVLYDVGEPEWLGVIQLDSLVTHHVFGPRDVELLVAISGQVALAIKNVMLVRTAQTTQSADWRRLERVVTNLPIGVVVLDDQRRCVLANPWIMDRAASIGGVVAGEVIDSLAGIACERLIGRELRDEVTIGMPERAYAVVAHPASDGTESVIVMSDITEDRARQTKAAHGDRLALVGQLAGGIAHDFNNLLCVILNNGLLLEESVATEYDQEAATAIVHASKRAANLVAQLLTYSRLEVIKPRVVDVGRLVTELEPLLRRTVDRRHALVVTVTAEVAKVLMDPSQVEQIVMNLVVNARDAMATAGQISVTVGIEQLAGANHVILEVTDNGTGMTPAVIARAFEPYFTTKDAGKGSGLGLATVHGIVHRAGGDITIDSAIGRGTRFRVVLPATDLTLDAIAAGLAGVSRGRILLVDDDDGVRRLAERMLLRAGFEVVCAASGHDALAVARSSRRFNLLLTDMVMPGMAGRELARALVRETPDLPVLFMSGYHLGTPIPGRQFLAKPFDRDALLTKIADAMTPAEGEGAAARLTIGEGCES